MRQPVEPSSPTARACLDAVRATPGTDAARVARALGVDHSTAAYHLDRLRRAGLVTATRTGRVLAHYVNGSGFCPVLRAALPVLAARDAPRAVTAWLADLPPGHAVRVPDVVRGARVTPFAARWALDRLERLGMVQRVAHGTFTLAPGAHVCARHAATTRPCGLWGACAPGARWTRASRET